MNLNALNLDEIGLTLYNPCLQLMLRVTLSHLVTLGWARTPDTENMRNEYRTYDQCVARISVDQVNH